MGAGIPSGLVTFVFTDIEGSTRRWQAEPDAMSDAVAMHDEVIRAEVDRREGHVFATGGDGFAIAFHKPSDAVEAACEIQRRLSGVDWPTADPICVRIGSHLGTATERNDDYFGPAVNLAARIEAAGHGGQILVSDDVARQARIDGRDLGEHRLKDIEYPVRIWQLDDGDHPALRTIEGALNTLPSLRTATVGREETIAELARALESSRLVTLTGPGGCGKTRAAVEVGAAILDAFNGTFFSDLTTADDGSDQVWTSLLAGIGLAPEGAVDSRVLGFLSERTSLLIVDNCEHVLDGAAEVIERLLDECAELKILATSREALDVDGERILRIPALALDASVRLFTERALDAGAELRSDDAAIASVCERLDGIPLAIELAAARTQAMSVTEIADRLDDRFALLSGGRRRNRGRQQTLRGVLDWSHDLLAEDEKRMLRRLAVFVAGFDLTDVAPVTGITEPMATDLVESLVAKSLVHVVRLDDGTLDRRLLETMRLYGLENLEVAGELDELRDRHVAHFGLSRLERTSAANMADPQTRAWELRRWPNVEYAIESLIDAGELGQAAALAARCVTGLLHVGRFTNYRELMIEQASAAASALQPSICAAAVPSMAFGDPDLGGRLATRAAELRADDPANEDLIFAEGALGWVHAYTDPRRGLGEAERLLELAEVHDASRLVRHALLTLKCSALETLGELDAASETAWSGADMSTTSGMLNGFRGTLCDMMRGHPVARSLKDARRYRYGSFDYLVPIAEVVAMLATDSPQVAASRLAKVAQHEVQGLIPSQEGDFIVVFAWLRLLMGDRERAEQLAGQCAPRLVFAEAVGLLGLDQRPSERLKILVAYSQRILDPVQREEGRAFNRTALAEEITYWT